VTDVRDGLQSNEHWQAPDKQFLIAKAFVVVAGTAPFKEAGVAGHCTENLIRVGDVMESPKLAG
jgi:hypothetical protein